MAWYLNPALTRFRDEVNTAFPRRDKASDGTIGDQAHRGTGSDHEEDPDGTVDAWDMDIDLRSGNDAQEIERLKALFETHPAAQYWIHNGRIASRDWGWQRRVYYGANPHDKHIHWNSREGYETSTKPWGVGADMPLTDADKPVIRAAVGGMEVGAGTGVSLTAAMHTTRTGVLSLMKTCEAILGALTSGADAKRIMARVEQLAAEDAKRDGDLAAAVGRVNTIVGQVGAVITQIKAGDVTSEGVARELARIIAAGVDDAPASGQ